MKTILPQVLLATAVVGLVAYPIFRARTEEPKKPVAAASSMLAKSAEDYRAGRFEECVADVQHALDADPKNSVAFTNMGACLGSLGRYDEEISVETQALKLDPGNSLAASNLSWALGRKAEARKK